MYSELSLDTYMSASSAYVPGLCADGDRFYIGGRVHYRVWWVDGRVYLVKGDFGMAVGETV